MIRVGFSKDIHNKVEGNHIYLGGILINCKFSVEAYSDGDVVIHSISEALLGAMGCRDLGYYFSNKNYDENFSSKIIIDFVRKKIIENNYKINNIDCMIVLDDLIIFDFIEDIKKSVSNLLGISVNYISIKATKSENNFKHFVECSTIVCIER